MPRLALILVWLLGDGYLTRAYETAFWPVLGFLFMPLTTLAYAFAWHREPTGSVEGLGDSFSWVLPEVKRGHAYVLELADLRPMPTAIDPR